MKLIGSGVLALVVACAGTLGAQSSDTTKTKTKTTIEGGKEVTVVGCVERSLDGGYTLSDGNTRYLLVGGKDLDAHVGQRVEVKGNATDRHHGTIKIKSKTESKQSDDTVHAKGEIKGDSHGLGVKSLKMIASSCP